MRFLIIHIILFLIISIPAETHNQENKKSKQDFLLKTTSLAKPVLFLIGLPGLSNVGQVAPGIYRGGQPDLNGYDTLKQMGVKVVLNLRTSYNEREYVEKAGMKYIEKPINIFLKINRKDINEIINIIKNPDNHPIYVHCRLGADRTGVVIAVYRIVEDGWSLNEIEKEMELFGFNNIWFHLKDFVKDYYNDYKNEN